MQDLSPVRVFQSMAANPESCIGLLTVTHVREFKRTVLLWDFSRCSRSLDEDGPLHMFRSLAYCRGQIRRVTAATMTDVDAIRAKLSKSYMQVRKLRWDY